MAFNDDPIRRPEKRNGRPPGSLSRLSKDAIALAKTNGRLPHEILLDIARGYPVALPKIDATGSVMWEAEGKPYYHFVVPTLDDVKDAAKAAAPYFAPKISTVEVISGVSDDELDRIIALAASEAGVSLSPCGEEQEGEEEEDADGEPWNTSERRRLNF